MFAEVFSYDQELIDKGVKQGIEQGLEQGEEKRAIEMAKAMLQDENELELISKYTKLSSSDLEKLKSEMQG